MADITQAKITPPMRRTLGRKTLIAGGLAVGIVLVYWVGQVLFLKATVQGEDGRPPIIVNNGSITFTAQPHSNGRGKWKADLTTPKWRLSHGGPAPLYLRVQDIRNSTTAACGAGAFFDGSAIALTYSDGAASLTLTMDVSGTPLPPFMSKHMKVDFNGATPTLTNDYTLTLPNPDVTRKLVISSIDITTLLSGPQHCDFAPGDSGFTARHMK